MRARTKAAAHNLAVLKHITLNLIRLDPVKRKSGICPEGSLLPPPTCTALNCSDLDDVHPIALSAIQRYASSALR
jgi:hypothetical protein